MRLTDADVPDLIGALADRFSEYDIHPRQAAFVTVEMLSHAFDELAAFEDASLVDAPHVELYRERVEQRQRERRKKHH